MQYLFWIGTVKHGRSTTYSRSGRRDHKSCTEAVSLEPPNETLINIINRVGNVDTVCLALTSHRLQDVVLIARGALHLTEICPPRPDPKYRLGSHRIKIDWHPPSFELDSEFETLMTRLWSWVGTKYKFCGRDGSNYLLRSWKGHENATLICGCFLSDTRRCIDEVNRQYGAGVLPSDAAMERMHQASERSQRFWKRCREAAKL